MVPWSKRAAPSNEELSRRPDASPKNPARSTTAQDLLDPQCALSLDSPARAKFEALLPEPLVQVCATAAKTFEQQGRSGSVWHLQRHLVPKLARQRSECAIHVLPNRTHIRTCARVATAVSVRPNRLSCSASFCEARSAAAFPQVPSQANRQASPSRPQCNRGARKRRRAKKYE